MSTTDLTDDERLALAGLIRLLVKADGEFSAEEAAAVGDLAIDVGEAPFWAAINRAAQELTDDDKIREAATKVSRPDARETIYAALLGIADRGTHSGDEDQLLDWLSEAWDLEVQTIADAVDE